MIEKLQFAVELVDQSENCGHTLWPLSLAREWWPVRHVAFFYYYYCCMFAFPLWWRTTVVFVVLVPFTFTSRIHGGTSVEGLKLPCYRTISQVDPVVHPPCLTRIRGVQRLQHVGGGGCPVCFDSYWRVPECVLICPSCWWANERAWRERGEGFNQIRQAQWSCVSLYGERHVHVQRALDGTVGESGSCKSTRSGLHWRASPKRLKVGFSILRSLFILNVSEYKMFSLRWLSTIKYYIGARRLLAQKLNPIGVLVLLWVGPLSPQNSSCCCAAGASNRCLGPLFVFFRPSLDVLVFVVSWMVFSLPCSCWYYILRAYMNNWGRWDCC